jgi:hypothetical protein
MLYIKVADPPDSDIRMVCAIARELSVYDILKPNIQKIEPSFREQSPQSAQAIAAIHGFQPLTINEYRHDNSIQSDSLKSLVAGGKGLAIIDTTKSGWVTAWMVSQCRNLAPWMASTIPGKAELLVFDSLSPQRAIGEIIPFRLICLKCWEEGNVNFLRSDAIYPYCRKHQDCSPHRH